MKDIFLKSFKQLHLLFGALGHFKFLGQKKGKKQTKTPQLSQLQNSLLEIRIKLIQAYLFLYLSS